MSSLLGRPKYTAASWITRFEPKEAVEKNAEPLNGSKVHLFPDYSVEVGMLGREAVTCSRGTFYTCDPLTLHPHLREALSQLAPAGLVPSTYLMTLDTETCGMTFLYHGRVLQPGRRRSVK